MEQSKRLGDDPVFPITKRETFGNGVTLDVDYPGITRRDYFAAQAMQGMMTRYGTIGPPDFPLISKISTCLADELLKELEKQ